MDQRDDPTWIAIELTYLGETKVEEGTFEASLRSDLGVGPDFPIFLPVATYVKDGATVVVHLMEGYAFVASGLPESSYFALERTSYVNRVLSSRTGPQRLRTLSVIPNQNIEELRLKLRQQIASDISVGGWVRATEGTYRALEGRVMGICGDNAFVQIGLRSLKIVATIPLMCLESQREPEGEQE